MSALVDHADGIGLALVGPIFVPFGDALLLILLGDEELGNHVGIGVDKPFLLQRVELGHERFVGFQSLVDVGADGGEIKMEEAVVVFRVEETFGLHFGG